MKTPIFGTLTQCFQGHSMARPQMHLKPGGPGVGTGVEGILFGLDKCLKIKKKVDEIQAEREKSKQKLGFKGYDDYVPPSPSTRNHGVAGQFIPSVDPSDSVNIREGTSSNKPDTKN